MLKTSQNVTMNKYKIQGKSTYLTNKEVNMTVEKTTQNSAMKAGNKEQIHIRKVVRQ